jgi:hypothetical protein
LLKLRHGRACPGHPRLSCVRKARRGCPAAQTSLRSLRKLDWVPGMTKGCLRLWRCPACNAANSTDALNWPFTALGETTRASAANARQFARLGFGERFRAQALISAQAPSRAASFFRAVEGSPDTGASLARKIKGPAEAGLEGGLLRRIRTTLGTGESWGQPLRLDQDHLTSPPPGL